MSTQYDRSPKGRFGRSLRIVGLFGALLALSGCVVVPAYYPRYAYHPYRYYPY
jgi:hypothetical protein